MNNVIINIHLIRICFSFKQDILGQIDYIKMFIFESYHLLILHDKLIFSSKGWLYLWRQSLQSPPRKADLYLVYKIPTLQKIRKITSRLAETLANLGALLERNLPKFIGTPIKIQRRAFLGFIFQPQFNK